MISRSIRSALVLILLSALCLLCAGCAFNRKATGPTLAEQVAEAYGVSKWDEITEIKYTFNVQNRARRTSRTWTWEPKAKRVTFEGPGPDQKQTTVTYRTFEVAEDSDESLRRIDHWFINDQYWLMFPFHLVWDDNVTITEMGEQPLPIGDGTARQLVVKFGDTGGYTPGDVYELFIDDDDCIMQWVFRRGGAEDSYNPATWENNTVVGPIMVCTDHYRPGSEFRLWFSDVSVK